MTNLERLVDEVEAGGIKVHGLPVTWEYPGFFQFTTKSGWSVTFVPDWDVQGELCIQVMMPDGESAEGWDIPYTGELTAATMTAMIESKLTARS